MELPNLLDSFRDAGLSLSLLPGGQIKVTPTAKITDEIRQKIRGNKDELIKLLSVPSDQHPGKAIPENSAERPEAPNTPAICTNCERLEMVEIMGKPLSGCLYTASGENTDGWKRLPDSLKVCMWAGIRSQANVKGPHSSHPEPSLPSLKKTKNRPSPVALAWLLEHRQALDDAGWTRAELYSRKKSNTSIAWLGLWDKPFVLTHLHASGGIEFLFSDGGRDVVQTARPTKIK